VSTGGRQTGKGTGSILR